MDVEKNQLLTNTFSKSGVPTILLFKNDICLEVPYPKDGYSEKYLMEYFVTLDIKKEFGDSNDDLL